MCVCVCEALTCFSLYSVDERKENFHLTFSPLLPTNRAHRHQTKDIPSHEDGSVLLGSGPAPRFKFLSWLERGERLRSSYLLSNRIH